MDGVATIWVSMLPISQEAASVTTDQDMLINVSPLNPDNLVIKFLNPKGEQQAFHFHRKHGIEVAKLLLDSVTTGKQPWGGKGR